MSPRRENPDIAPARMGGMSLREMQNALPTQGRTSDAQTLQFSPTDMRGKGGQDAVGDPRQHEVVTIPCAMFRQCLLTVMGRVAAAVVGVNPLYDYHDEVFVYGVSGQARDLLMAAAIGAWANTVTSPPTLARLEIADTSPYDAIVVCACAFHNGAPLGTVPPLQPAFTEVVNELAVTVRYWNR